MFVFYRASQSLQYMRGFHCDFQRGRYCLQDFSDRWFHGTASEHTLRKQFMSLLWFYSWGNQGSGIRHPPRAHEWVSEWVKSLSRVRLFATPWTVAHQAPPSMEFSKQEYWSGLPFPSPGDLPDPGIKPASPALQADALSPEPPGKPDVCMMGKRTRSKKLHSHRRFTVRRVPWAPCVCETSLCVWWTVQSGPPHAGLEGELKSVCEASGLSRCVKVRNLFWTQRVKGNSL